MPAPRLSPALRQTLTMTAGALLEARDPWWIISSAAVALHGAEPGDVGDVDVLASPRDARGVLAALGIESGPGGRSDRFRSAVFGQWRGPPLAVEIMADFHVRGPGGWTRVAPETRVAIDVDGHDLFVPERSELGALLRGFGRPKDLARAALLDREACLGRTALPRPL